MKTLHTTNYQNTFITIAEDCPALRGEIPPLKGDSKTIAGLQFDMLYDKPYVYTSDDVLFAVFARRNELPEEELDEAKMLFFSKGQACLRASPLTKRYGWGVHSNEEGKITLYGCETEEYNRLANDTSLKVVKAMKSGK